MFTLFNRGKADRPQAVKLQTFNRKVSERGRTYSFPGAEDKEKVDVDDDQLNRSQMW